MRQGLPRTRSEGDGRAAGAGGDGLVDGAVNPGDAGQVGGSDEDSGQQSEHGDDDQKMFGQGP